MDATKRYELYIKACVKARVEPLNPTNWMHVGEPATPSIQDKAKLHAKNPERVLAGNGADNTIDTQSPVNLDYDDPRCVPEYPAPDTVTIIQWKRAWEYRVATNTEFKALVQDAESEE